MQKKRPAVVKSRNERKVARDRSSKAAAKKPAGKRGAKPGADARPAAAAATGVLVVNMIPKSLSTEENQDSEPMIAVNPADRDYIVGTAFTPDPFGSGLAPYFVSTDGGATWRLNAVVPGGNQTGDITVAFSGAGRKLYAGILRLDSPTTDTRMSILRCDDFAAPTPMTVLADRQQPDQPFTQAAVQGGGVDAGKENFYVGNNDFANMPQTATIDIGLDAGSATPAINSVRLERRANAGQNGPQVRPSVHSDGTVYAAFYGWRSQAGDWPSNTLRVTADAVVVRDDSWGRGPQPFEALTDPADGVVGRRVAQNLGFAFNQTGLPENGQQRLGGALSIAVDPRPTMSSTVYLAWGADDSDSNFAVDVRVSRDRGVTWSPSSLLPLSRATNAALAVNSNGIVGLLYQQLVGSGVGMRWETHFRRSSDTTTWSDLVVASAPAGGPAKDFDPYLGDYCHVLAVGEDFYGVFSSANTPDPANFPNGVTYQRNADFTTRKLFGLDGTTQVRASIDPFFFKITGSAGSADLPSRKRGADLPEPRHRGQRRPR
ncbi:MAG TPA: hypothetical protein VJY34_12590 [Roseiarcus sp.]|nr:hypothetical protein [Roseiarcus sp.]